VTAYEKTDAGVEIADAWKPLLTDASIGLLGSTLRAEPWLGVTRETGLSRREGAMFLNKVQQYVRDHTRLGIPLFVTDDAHRGQQAIGATIFPQLCAMGPTWNPGLQESVARAIALEMRSQGVTIAFAPNLDVIRDPRWGRSDQNFGEDPWLVAEMGKAAVRGFQGASLNTDHSVVALLRAYPGLGDADGGHDFTGFSRGMRDLHEVVLRPWGEAIRAGAEGVMIEQSEMDGVPVPCVHDAGYRKHLDLDAAGPLYPFGFGLSYTTFKHTNLKILPQSIRMGESAQVTVDVTNTGKIAGDEVVHSTSATTWRRSRVRRWS
jgi:beta-glucosidase